MPNLKPLISTYLSSLHTVHDSGKATDERSYYPPLAALFNGVGTTLSPHVVALLEVADQGQGKGIGHPDFLLQVDTAHKDIRAAVEVKGSAPELDTIIHSEQVKRYLTHHDPIIVTNLREFALVKVGKNHLPEVIMRETFASSEAAFWLASPTTIANQHAESFADFLQAAMTWNAVIKRPGELAEALARYARETLRRLESQPPEAMAGLRKALADALGLQFTGAEGEHFFRSSLVQTLFYGLFSAWVACNQRGNCDDFRWKDAGDYLGLPLLRELFEEIAKPSQLEKLDIRKPLEWAEATLKRTVWEDFSKVFDEADAVNYFYEPFLEAFDPQLRRDLGVWYTPPEIVRYMVARVDTVLREELGIADGLADPSVYVLDPCCGTGAYVLEVLRHIAATLKDKGEDALLAAEMKKAASERVFGFEILPAPFVVAQLQIGLLLSGLGAPLTGTNRASIYLTNALTGWDNTPVQLALDNFPELKKEAESAAEVKQDKPILVILGNPPYSAFAGTSSAEENGLVEPYKVGLSSEWNIKKFNLDDLYVRFFRLAERRIAEKTGRGIVCYISNASYLNDQSYVVMRQRFVTEFDKLWIDNLNGDSRETGKVTPDGKPDPSVFSTASNHAGIRIGTAINLMVRQAKRGKRSKPSLVRHRDFWGVTKREDLLNSLTAADFNAQYQTAIPAAENRFALRPVETSEAYMSWPKVVDLCALAPQNGLMEKRGGALFNTDRAYLEKQMRAYFDKKLSWDAYTALGYGLVNTQARFDPTTARKKALASERFSVKRLVRYTVRPFDTQWCYYTGIRPVWNEPRPTLWAQCWPGNRFLLTRVATEKANEGMAFCFTSTLSDNHILSPHSYAIPLLLKNGHRLSTEDEGTLFSLLGKKPEADSPFANLSKMAREYLAALGFADPDQNIDIAETIWLHALAIGYSPVYLAENADGIRQDWPRIPLPATREVIKASSALGQQIAALLDSEKPVEGVTTGKIRDALKPIGALSKVGGGQLNPDVDFKLQARWGYGGRDGITMPGQGKTIERDLTDADLPSPGTQGEGQGVGALGTRTVDVYLNDAAYWRNVPLPVWEYTIGGYQVIKKWLSYREFALLGRSLTLDEVREVQNIARRIAAILLLEADLDANYAAVKATTMALA